MAEIAGELENRIARLYCNAPSDRTFLKSARMVEGISQISELTIEFLSDDTTMKLGDVVGHPMTVELDDSEDSEKRYFSGHCISAEFIGVMGGYTHHIATVRPWLWFLTKTSDCRIFQEMDAVAIIQEIFGDHGFSSDVINRTNRNCLVRTYCVQYRESDFDFISRLMEEEGIFYFFEYQNGIVKLVLSDDAASCSDIASKELEFFFRDENYGRKDDHIYDFSAIESVRSGKVTLEDYNFETPTAELKSVATVTSGDHSQRNYGMRDYPGHFPDTGAGDTLARFRMQAEAAGFQRWRGEGNVRRLAVGQKFELSKHPLSGLNKGYLTVSATHYIQVEEFLDDDDADAKKNRTLTENRLSFENNDTYRSVFETVEAGTEYRTPRKTRWPEISGLHTAVVMGPDGEEIYTDEYGRIKVKFHWDANPAGANPEAMTCWVRCAVPWSGKNWGMISVPRIGQEVIIQFEEGNPDRPICTGMLYNDANKPPYTLPANMTQTGIVTRSSKTGTASTFNELLFEDKKDAEFVRLQSEKDYTEIIKNNAVITIGMEKKDDGDLTQTVYHSQTENVETGDLTVNVKEGNEIRDIATDHTETIGNDASQSIGNDSSISVGNNVTQDVGNDLTLDVGSNITENAGQKITIEAGSEILLKVGGSSIKIDNTGVTVSGTQIKINGKGTIDAKSPSTTVEGSALLTLKGGMTMIN